MKASRLGKVVFADRDHGISRRDPEGAATREEFRLVRLNPRYARNEVRDGDGIGLKDGFLKIVVVPVDAEIIPEATADIVTVGRILLFEIVVERVLAWKGADPDRNAALRMVVSLR
jgi:hypothetical protein